MSWNGLKKAINRAGAQVKIKTGHIDQSADLEFDYQEKRFHAMEKASLRLHKELRNYKDLLHALAQVQASMGDVLAGFYRKDEKSVATVYQQAMREVVESGEELEQPYLQTVLNPIERFNSYYVDVNEAIKKRSHKKIDYDALKAKVQKLIDNPKEDPASELKLRDTQEELARAQTSYGVLNSQLKDELPQLIEMRIPYLNPSFEAFVKIQLRFFGDNYARLNKVQKQLDAESRHDFVSGQLDKKMDDVLNKIRELNVAL
ncbi:CIC11C00000004685 [Sungouiella intermedia]|uniref:CIC11C00000004685 n=1 Tax=Sungouiella intermedia TaxID=45354 RepID=A0A1L0DGC0_9ASCO|nr:CIC11C00000004685 [[Candida] intermedia]